MVDALVTDVIAARLPMPDAVALVETVEDSPQAQAIAVVIGEQRVHLLRAQRDQDEAVIEGRNLKRIRDAATARIVELGPERLLRGRSGDLAHVLRTSEHSTTIKEASLDIRRRVIGSLCMVTLLPWSNGSRCASLAAARLMSARHSPTAP